MSVFGNYARYYDLLYKDKDYVGETKFIHQLLQNHAPNAKSILELGCGTGHHATLLAKEGYDIHGIDLSEDMLARASERLAGLPKDLASRLNFSYGDIRKVRLAETFDVVLSLFHVISYQTTNDDLLAAFATAKEHLNSGGVFIFDVWYGPAVLTDRPTVRVKKLEDEYISVTRIAEPIMYPNENWVDVNYQVFIRDKQNGQFEELKETHRMRYLFKSEIEFIANQLGMKLLESKEWMSDRMPDSNTWNIYFILQV